MQFRIKETNGIFIPQCRESIFDLMGWGGINLQKNEILYADTNQMIYCGCKTLEEAKDVIEKFKPKYHKI